jgi:hypothetical protein
MKIYSIVFITCFFVTYSIETDSESPKTSKQLCLVNIHCIENTFLNYCCTIECCNMVQYITRDK